MDTSVLLEPQGMRSTHFSLKWLIHWGNLTQLRLGNFSIPTPTPFLWDNYVICRLFLISIYFHSSHISIQIPFLCMKNKSMPWTPIMESARNQLHGKLWPIRSASTWIPLQKNDKQMKTSWVVSTHLKNISQIGNLPQIGLNTKKNIWNHHLENLWLNTVATHVSFIF